MTRFTLKNILKLGLLIITVFLIGYAIFTWRGVA